MAQAELGLGQSEIGHGWSRARTERKRSVLEFDKSISTVVGGPSMARAGSGLGLGWANRRLATAEKEVRVGLGLANGKPLLAFRRDRLLRRLAMTGSGELRLGFAQQMVAGYWLLVEGNGFLPEHGPSKLGLGQSEIGQG